MAKILIDNPHFRPGTQTERKEVVFKFTLPGHKSAALGDCISWLPSIIYLAENYNYVQGHLIVPRYFLPIAQNILSSYPHWRVHDHIPDRLANGFPLREPTSGIPNATTMSLTDLGFIYFAGTSPPPPGSTYYPLLNLDDVAFPEFGVTSEPYVVMTPGNSAPSRTMPKKVYDDICKYLLSMGVTPVHLGVTSMNGGLRPINYEDYDLSIGINLVDKTSLLEAAKIMERASLVLGIDNGLLHLASLTDTTVIFGYTIAGPDQRRPNRKYGHLVELYADKEKLPCLFCQERVRFFIDHDFTNCIYKDFKCVKALNSETWISTIENTLHERR